MGLNARPGETQGQILERLLEYGRAAIKHYPIPQRYDAYRERIRRLPISDAMKEHGLARWERIIKEREGR